MRYWWVLGVMVLGFSLSGCVAAVVGGAAEGGYIAAQKERSGRETVNDQWITSKVKSMLLFDDDTSGLAINVDTYQRVVTLHGEVSSTKELQEAIRIARSVDGVYRVVSKLRVR